MVQVALLGGLRLASTSCGGNTITLNQQAASQVVKAAAQMKQRGTQKA